MSDKFDDYFKSINSNTYKYINGEILSIPSRQIFDRLKKNDNLIFENVFLNEDALKGYKFENVNIKFKEFKLYQEFSICLENGSISFEKNIPVQEYPEHNHIDIQGKVNSVNLNDIDFEYLGLQINTSLKILKIEKFQLGFLTINGNQNSIEKIRIEKQINIKECSEIKLLDFNCNNLCIENILNTGRISFQNINSDELKLKDTNIKNIIDFDNYNIRNFIIERSNIKNLNISISKISNSKYLKSSKYIEKEIYPNMESIKSISNSRIGVFNLSSDNFDEISVLDEINLLKVDEYNLNNIKSKNIYFNNRIENESVIINCEFSNIHFLNFYSKRKFFLKNISLNKSNSSLIIKSSTLENTILDPSFLNHINKLVFYNSTLTDLKVINFTNIPDKAIHPRDEDQETNYLILYRELKSLASKYGDNYLYHKFKALEYNERLKGKLNFLDRSVLEFNKFTNNHTTDWIKAFKLLLITIGFYLSLITSYLLYSYNGFQFMDVSIILPYLLSPVSFLVNNSEYYFPNFIYFIDILYNIIIGLLLYQMIAAFRKFSR